VTIIVAGVITELSDEDRVVARVDGELSGSWACSQHPHDRRGVSVTAGQVITSSASTNNV
jgi:hypothetical protein